MRTWNFAAVIAGIIGVAAVASRADLINIQGSSANSTEGLCSFTGSIEYNYQSANLGQLIVHLTNTTDAGIGGKITGFVFNIGAPQRSGTDAAVLLFSSHPALVNIPGPGISAAPFGLFDAGAAIGADFLGGGNPNAGVAVGATGDFEFQVNSTYANLLQASSFIQGPNDFNFVVRFRGLLNGGSDKVPVPAPGSLALLGLSTMASGARRRRHTV